MRAWYVVCIAGLVPRAVRCGMADSPPHDSRDASDAVSALAAENRRLREELREARGSLRQLEDRVAWLQEIGGALRDADKQDTLLQFIMDRIQRLMAAERATLFLMEEDGRHLWSRITTDSSVQEIRVRMGEGIAGWVAMHGKSVNIKDAYRDTRFSAHFDQRTGFRTRSVLCQAMRDKAGRIFGVVQVLNRLDGYFGVDDESLLSAITNTAAIVLENQRLYLDQVDRSFQLQETQKKLQERIHVFNMLHDVHTRVLEAEDLDEVIAAIANSAANSIESQGAAITVLEGGVLVEYAFQRVPNTDRFVRVERNWDSSVRDEVLQLGRPLRCNTLSTMVMAVGADTSTGDGVLRRPWLEVANVLAVPLVARDTLLGCIELINRRGVDPATGNRRGFTEDDQKTLDLIGGQISSVVYRQLVRRRQEVNERLSAIGGMLSGVVHDLKTPMTVARGYVQFMARSDDPERRRTLAKKVDAQFDTMTGMTRELLAYARGDSQLYLRTVHIHAFADEMQEWLEQEFRGSGVEARVEAHYRGDARIDDGKLKRVLFNLARNAREAMRATASENPAIRASLEANGDPGATLGQFAVTFDRQGDDLVIVCEDDGPGIPEAIRLRMFEMFVSSRREGNSGLGLSIVKKLVDDHGGRVSFRCPEAGGTVFEVRIPLRLEDALAAETDGITPYAGTRVAAPQLS